MADKKYFLATYSNGYCGCTEHDGVIADSLEQAEKYFCDEELIYQYGDEYTYCCLGDEYTDDEYEQYIADISVEVREVTKEVLEEYVLDEPFDIR